jgi:hypothetical protein
MLPLRGLVLLAILLCVPYYGYAQQQPPLTIDQRIGIEVGPIIVRAGVLAAQNEQLTAQVAALQKQIEDLKKQLEEKKPVESKP